MKLDELVEQIKARSAYTRRRAKAVTQHGRSVVTAGVDAAQHVAAVAVDNLKTTLEAQKATLTDRRLPVKARFQKVRLETGDALVDAKAEVIAALQGAVRSVGDKLVRVTATTHKEQALENKIRRKASKARKTALRRSSAAGRA